jgi:hemerythrin-like domain-containing protein
MNMLLTDPIGMIASAHRLQLEACNALELIADGLPESVDRRLCAQAAVCLHYDLPVHYRDEEEALFPLIRKRAEKDDKLGDTLERLVEEHREDADLASEIADPLDLLGRGEKVRNPEMVGYMLRGFFERYRRHVKWEESLILPLARLRLSPADLSDLSVSMSRIRAQAD